MALSKNENKRKKQLANLEKGKFKKGEVTNPKGRPPKPRTMTTFIAEMKEKGYEVPTAQTIAESFLYIATLPEDELKAVLADKTRPMMQRIVAKGILDKKGMDILERVVDRAYGKIQHIDLTSKGEQIKNNEPVTIRIVNGPEEYQKIKNEIEKQMKEKNKEDNA